MTTAKTVRVGQMPGKINEYAVSVGQTVASVLALAGLNASGKQINIDGRTGSASETITAGTNLILLTEQVKGNSDAKTVRVGQMPGKINEYAVRVGDTVASVLTLAGLSASGKQINIDGRVGKASETITAGTNLILLTEQVKGN